MERFLYLFDLDYPYKSVQYLLKHKSAQPKTYKLFLISSKGIQICMPLDTPSIAIF